MRDGALRGETSRALVLWQPECPLAVCLSKLRPRDRELKPGDDSERDDEEGEGEQTRRDIQFDEYLRTRTAALTELD